MVPLAVSRWININLAVSMEPAERRTLVKTAELLLKHMKNVPNSTELKCRLSWIIVQSRIDAKDYESASKLLDKVRFLLLGGATVWSRYRKGAQPWWFKGQFILRLWWICQRLSLEQFWYVSGYFVMPIWNLIRLWIFKKLDPHRWIFIYSTFIFFLYTVCIKNTRLCTLKILMFYTVQ